MSVSFTTSGSWKKTENLLRNLSRGNFFQGLDSLAQQGVNALSAATPQESGLAKQSWRYEIESSKTALTITWLNSDVESGFPVAIMLQYGYATGTGGYVQGLDYINPAMRPIFDQIAEKVWKAVKSS